MEPSPSENDIELVDLLETGYIDKNTFERMAENRTEMIKMDQKFQHRNYFKSCCFILDRRLLLFWAQFIFSLAIISVCLYQMITIEECDARSMYSGLLGATMGFWIPQPNIN